MLNQIINGQAGSVVRSTLNGVIDVANLLANASGPTVTANAPMLDMAQTWNNSGVVFTGARMTVTDTASDASSKLIDLKVGSTSRFNVGKNGYLSTTVDGIYNDQAIAINESGSTTYIGSSNNHLVFTPAAAGAGHFQFGIRYTGELVVNAANDMGLYWGGPGNLQGGWTEAIVRDGASILAQRATTHPQTFRIYNTYTDSSNYERGTIDWNASSNLLTIGTEAAGTGSLRVLRLKAGGGNFDIGNFYVICNNGLNMNNNVITAALQFQGASTVVANNPILDIAQTWNNSGVNFTGAKLNVTPTAYGSSSRLLDVQLGGTSCVRVEPDGNLVVDGQTGFLSTTTFSTRYQGTQIFSVATTTANGVLINNRLGFYNVDAIIDFAGGPVLHGQVNGTFALEQRNTTNAQTFRVYNTYTDASNYERGIFDWNATSNTLTIGTEALGTGTVRNVKLQTGSNTYISIGSDGTTKFMSPNSSVAATVLVGGYPNYHSASITMDPTYGIYSLLTESVSGTLAIGSSAIEFWAYYSGYTSSHMVARMQYDNFVLAPTTTLVFSDYFNGGDIGGSVGLLRDADNTLAQRASTRPQTFRLYGTYTDASNYERLALGYDSTASAFTLGMEALGTGTPRNIAIKSGVDGLSTSATVTMTIASPCVVTWFNHGFNAGQPVKFTTTGALPTGLTAGTTYYVSATSVGINNFRVTATPGGADINTSGSQSGTHTGTGQTDFIPQTIATFGPPALTGSQTTPLLNMSQNWNTNGVATGYRFNVNARAIWGSGSMVAEFQANGGTLFGMTINGSMSVGDSINATSGVANTGFANYSGLGLIGGATSATSMGTAIAVLVKTGQWMLMNSDIFLCWGNVNNGTADLLLWREAANTLAQSNNTVPQKYRLYNTWSGTGGANYERLTLDTNLILNNAMPIYTEAGGTGSVRDLALAPSSNVVSITNGANVANGAILRLYRTYVSTGNQAFFQIDNTGNGCIFSYYATGAATSIPQNIQFNCATGNMNYVCLNFNIYEHTGATAVFTWDDTNSRFNVKQLANGNDTFRVLRQTDSSPTGYYMRGRNAADSADIWEISATGAFGFNNDVGISRVTAGVLAIGNATAADTTGWIQWGGATRVTGDVSVTSSTAFSTATGLSVNVQAGRTYSFDACLLMTCAAAGGVKAQIAGSCTATNIYYIGYALADNAVKGKAVATALATTVGSTVTTETSGIMIVIKGTITVNAAGTLLVQFSQNTSSGTATIVKQGSYFIVHDMK